MLKGFIVKKTEKSGHNQNKVNCAEYVIFVFIKILKMVAFKYSTGPILFKEFTEAGPILDI